MDRIMFTKSIELPLNDGTLQERFPEIMAIYNLIEIDKYKVVAHVDENFDGISFTVYCKKDEAISISNVVQNYIMHLYGMKISTSYQIHKEGIDLFLTKIADGA